VYFAAVQECRVAAERESMSNTQVALKSWEAPPALRGYDPGRNKVPLALLPSRLVLFAAFQALIAAAIWLLQGTFSLTGAAIYWPFAAFGANCATVLILRRALRKEGLQLRDIYRFREGGVGKDVLATVVIFVAAAPLAMFPNMILANALFGGADAVTPLMFGRMPLPLALLTVTFPLSIAFAELPLYLGYITPRLNVLTGRRVGSALIAAFFLALQHCTLPLVPDVRFIIWRFGMFLPLALLLALAFTWRPRLLPYLMIGHALLDLTTVVMIVGAALK
jgi:hypothetical protein